VVSVDGERVGTHDGYCRFTVGQRKRLPGGFSAPMYVLDIEPHTRTVVIGPAEALRAARVAIVDQNWLTGVPAVGSLVSLQIRHRGHEVAGQVEEVGPERTTIRLQGSHRAVTPGQSAAVYDGDVLLGGGRIARERRSLPIAST
jgi:tRNA-specific 2-thiouridylase